ncbi:hypothetical protein [Flexivirga alba]|uniref:ABC transporter ATP-binding protein n=1 Tax=Flexivirga alba TaxID=702742 RepID=A0ABW2AGG2_9MICO
MTTTKNELAVEATGLVKTFGNVRAVDGIDLRVHPGKFSACSAPTAPARQRC